MSRIQEQINQSEYDKKLDEIIQEHLNIMADKATQEVQGQDAGATAIKDGHDPAVEKSSQGSSVKGNVNKPFTSHAIERAKDVQKWLVEARFGIDVKDPFLVSNAGIKGVDFTWMAMVLDNNERKQPREVIGCIRKRSEHGDLMKDAYETIAQVQLDLNADKAWNSGI